jgi:hypothetical protein
MKHLEDMTEPELRTTMNAMARGVVRMSEVLKVDKPLFVLVLFNDPKVAQYVSNCTRESMIAAMRETADRLERNQDVPR